MNHLKNVHQAKFSFVCVLFATGKYFISSLVLSLFSFFMLNVVALPLTGEHIY